MIARHETSSLTSGGFCLVERKIGLQHWLGESREKVWLTLVSSHRDLNQLKILGEIGELIFMSTVFWGQSSYPQGVTHQDRVSSMCDSLVFATNHSCRWQNVFH